MRMLTKSLIVTAVATALVGAVAAQQSGTVQHAGQGTTPHPMMQGGMRHPGPGGPGMGRMGHGPFGGLNLTEQQSAEIQKLMQAHQPDQQAAMESMRKLQQELHKAIFTGADTTAVAGQINELQATMLRSRIDAQKAVAALLTDEQRKLASERDPGMMAGRPGLMGLGGRGMRHGLTPPAQPKK